MELEHSKLQPHRTSSHDDELKKLQNLGRGRLSEVSSHIYRTFSDPLKRTGCEGNSLTGSPNFKWMDILTTLFFTNGRRH